MTKLFPRMYVGHVHFHHGRIDRCDRIAQCIAVMRERSRVENDPVRICFLNTGAKLAFKIALEKLALRPGRVSK